MIARRICLLVAFAQFTMAAQTPSSGKPVMSDGFDAPKIDPAWKISWGFWKAEGGSLRGSELPADSHAAILRRKVSFTNGTVVVRFRFDGSRQWSLILDGATGHLCRVAVRPEGFRILNDSANDAEMGRSKAAIAAGQWHELRVTMQGQKITAQIGSAILSGTHPSLAAAKTEVQLGVNTVSTMFDSIEVSAAN